MKFKLISIFLVLFGYKLFSQIPAPLSYTVFAPFINEIVKEKSGQKITLSFKDLRIGSVEEQSIEWDQKNLILKNSAKDSSGNLTVTTQTLGYIDGYVSHLYNEKNRIESSKSNNASYNQKIYKEGKLVADNAIIKKKDSEVVFSQLGIDAKGQPIIHITETFTVTMDSSNKAIGLKIYELAEGKKVVTYKSETFIKSIKDKPNNKITIKEAIRSSYGEKSMPEIRLTFILSLDEKGNVISVECPDQKKSVAIIYNSSL